MLSPSDQRPKRRFSPTVAPHHFQGIVRLAQLLTRADDADRVERLLGERARHAPGVRGSIGPSTSQAVAQGVPNQRVQPVASVVADNQERAALGDRTQRGRPRARTKQPLRRRGRDRFEHRQHFQELLLGLVEPTQDLALDVVAQQRAVADAELARGTQQDARDPAFGLLVVGRISANGRAQGLRLLGCEPQVLGAKPEHVAAGGQARDRQRRNLARSDDQLAHFGQPAHQGVDAVENVIGAVEQVQVVQDQDEARGRIGQVAEQEPREADALGAGLESPLQLLQHVRLLEGGFEAARQAREEPLRISVRGLQREPRDDAAAVACIRCREGRFAKARGCNQQDQRAGAVPVEKLEKPVASQLVRGWGGYARRQADYQRLSIGRQRATG